MNAHLLIVDDDERIRSLLKQFLLRNGFLVSAARDAMHARKILSGLDFDMIILDVMMPGEEIIHVLPQEYKIDGQTEIMEPVGMFGGRLEANFHVVVGQVSSIKNIARCVKSSGIDFDGITLEPLASADAVLSIEEKEAGVALVDIGGGTTDIAVFQRGAIQHTAVIPIAGDQVTNDIAVSMRTPTQYAEEIKIKYACALSQLANPDETIEVPSTGDRPPRRLARQTLAEIVEPRFEELFSLIRNELRRSGFEESIPAGLVITGGSSKMEGAVELAEEIFHVPVRLGAPQYVEGLVNVVRNPIHATGVGLLLYGRESQNRVNYNRLSIKNDVKEKWESLKSWIQNQF